MISRILLILKTQNLSSSQFADEIGVQRSSISHILSGRNNPSLEFVTKILKRYPEINSDWIIFGKGSMYKGSDSNTDLQTKEIKKNILQPDLFNFDVPEQDVIQPVETDESDKEYKYDNLSEVKSDQKETITPDIQFDTKEIKEEKTEQKFERKIETEEKTMEINLTSKTMERIVIFYNDKTFKEYLPE